MKEFMHSRAFKELLWGSLVAASLLVLHDQTAPLDTPEQHTFSLSVWPRQSFSRLHRHLPRQWWQNERGRLKHCCGSGWPRRSPLPAHDHGPTASGPRRIWELTS